MLVGVAKESFTVHEDIICARSNFFKAAVSKDWKEAGSKTVNLPEQTPAVFKAYLESVYFPNADLLELVKSHAHDLVLNSEDRFKKDIVLAKAGHGLVKLYLLGDFVGDVLLKNEIIRAIVEGCNGKGLYFQTKVLNMVFDGTPTDCGLQKVVADIVAKELVIGGLVEGFVKSVSPSAVSATLKAVVAKRCGDKWARKFDAGKYIED